MLDSRVQNTKSEEIMDLYKKQILKILNEHSRQTISRMELENIIKHIGKRAILGHLSSLIGDRRIEVLGQSSSTVYQITDAYCPRRTIRSLPPVCIHSVAKITDTLKAL